MANLLHIVRTFCMLSFFIAAPQLAAAEKTKKTSKPSPVAEIPIKIVNNRVQFEVLAGDIPLTVLLDTGATSSIYFHSEKLKKINPTTSGKASIAFPAINRSVIGQRIEAIPLQSGKFKFVSRGGLLIGDDELVASQLEAEYDAIIGQEFFRAYTVEIDPSEQRLKLYRPGTDMRRHFETSHRLYMEGHTPHIRFFSQMPWERRPTSKAMLLDTGYPGSLVLWNKRHYREALVGGQTISSHENSAGIVSHIKLKFASLEFENIPVFIASSVPRQALKRDGLIGASMLAQYRHVIDFSAGRLYMSPIYGASGAPLQIIDGLIYTPNNENFDLKTYYPKVSMYPTLVIFASGKVESK